MARKERRPWGWMALLTGFAAAVLAVWGAMQTVYALECIRLSKRTGDA